MLNELRFHIIIFVISGWNKEEESCGIIFWKVEKEDVIENPVPNLVNYLEITVKAPRCDVAMWK